MHDRAESPSWFYSPTSPAPTSQGREIPFPGDRLLLRGSKLCMATQKKNVPAQYKGSVRSSEHKQHLPTAATNWPGSQSVGKASCPGPLEMGRGCSCVVSVYCSGTYADHTCLHAAVSTLIVPKIEEVALASLWSVLCVYIFSLLSPSPPPSYSPSPPPLFFSFLFKRPTNLSIAPASVTFLRSDNYLFILNIYIPPKSICQISSSVFSKAENHCTIHTHTHTNQHSMQNTAAAKHQIREQDRRHENCNDDQYLKATAWSPSF